MMAPIKLSVFYLYIYMYMIVCWENFKTNKQTEETKRRFRCYKRT